MNDRHHPTTFHLIVGLALSAALGCDSAADSDPDMSVQADPTVAVDCDARCAGKYVACGGPAGGQGQVCASVCGGGLSAAQLDCLEATSCFELEDIIEGGSTFDDVCPGQSSGSCDGITRCDGSQTVTCDPSTNQITTRVCPDGCEDGECKAAPCTENGASGCFPGPSCCDPLSICAGTNPTTSNCCRKFGAACGDGAECCSNSVETLLCIEGTCQ